ncbi:MAG: GIY-YIG nuclease family protein [Thermosynechococcaceae cyanobacterium MS004]|nr:GIY-YIG nuclease family protein [Thermosynechococcaceae cyanobacterium MS004]
MSDPAQGWGWVEVSLADAQRFGIKTEHPSSRRVTKRKLKYDETTDSVYEYIDQNHVVRPPSRGKAGGKKFAINIQGEILTINVQKSLTNDAVCAWIRTWAPPEAKIITPGNRAYSIEGEKLAHQAHFVYFILNADSNAIKIGRARDLGKRMKALQTSSPAELQLLKSIQVNSAKEAEELEKSLHRRFYEIRLAGEWFKAEGELLEYIQSQPSAIS